MIELISLFAIGLTIVLNPCTYFLLPLVFAMTVSARGRALLYRIINFIFGFLLGLVALSVLSFYIQKIALFTSVKLAIGLLLIAFGIYSLYKPVIAVHFNLKTKSLLLLGFFIPFITNGAGCSLALFTSILPSISISQPVNLLAFGAGMLVPYILMFLGGDLTIRMFRKLLPSLNKIIHVLTPILFILTGLYTVFSVNYLGRPDIEALFKFLIVTFALLLFGIYKKTKDLRFVLAAFVAMITIALWVAALAWCNTLMGPSPMHSMTGPVERLPFLSKFIHFDANPYVCNDQLRFCPYCLTCNILLVGISVATTYIYLKVLKIINEAKK